MAHMRNLTHRFGCISRHRDGNNYNQVGLGDLSTTCYPQHAMNSKWDVCLPANRFLRAAE